MKLRTLVIVVMLLLAAFLVWSDALGDDGHGRDHHDDGGGSLASADSVLDNVIRDDSLRLGHAFSYGMGDVDINEGQNCMGSEQKANILFGKQELALNAWCASLFYELNGKHTFAAKLRCGIPEIGNQYTTVDACVKDQDLSPLAAADVENLYDEQRSQDHEIDTVQMAQVSFEQRITALEKKPAPRPRRVQAAPQPAPEPEMTIEEKEAILALLLYKDDEDE